MPEILIAFLILGVTGVLMGALLAVASHFMAVPEDETVVKLRKCLPGANCGACGYTGCDDYAKALAEGQAKPNLCIPGGGDSAGAISEILGVEAEAPITLMAVVACNGNRDANPERPAYDGMQTCKAAAVSWGGPNACPTGCLGFGDCMAACPHGAIGVKNGVAVVNPRLCVGCGLCASACPKRIIFLETAGKRAVNICSNREKGAICRKTCKNACIACGKCEKLCPNDAVHVIDNLAVVDPTRCTACGLCVEGCPTGCLKMADFRPQDHAPCNRHD